MVMTEDGPVSTCQHDPRRDNFLLKPVKLDRPEPACFDPQSGTVLNASGETRLASLRPRPT